MFESMFTQLTIRAIGWALLHFIWQGALVALLLANLLKTIAPRRADLRYGLACLALFSLAILPVATTGFTAVSISDEFDPLPSVIQAPETAGNHSTAKGVVAPPTASATPQWRQRVSGWMDAGMPWLTAVWLLGVALFSLRLLGGYAVMQRVKRRATRPVAGFGQARFQQLCARLNITRSVRLFESAMVRVPTAIGWLRPVILLPASAVTGLTPQQLEAILAHELAHIRRCDYLVNLLQRGIETLLFYHPAVWWVSRQVSIEREHCCDDIAVEACQDALVYARALAQLEELRAAEPQLALAATGGSLLSRIHRLLGMAEPGANQLKGSLAGAIGLLTVVIIAANAHHSFTPNFNYQSPTSKKAEVVHPALAGQDKLSVRDLRDLQSLLALLNDEDVFVRDGAITALGKLGDKRAVEPLIALLQDKNIYIRDNTITALGRLGDRRAVEPLIALLKDASVDIRDNAAQALGLLGDSRAIAPLKASLTDENSYVRHTASKALAQLKAH